jgi:putative phage-type endonuclease
MLDHEIRRRGIGGSEVAAILGLSRYRTPYVVWLDKMGLLAPMPPSKRMLFGQLAEAAILKAYAHETKCELVTDHKSATHPERPWMVATADALVVGEKRGVDAKMIAWDQSFHWPPTAAEIPDEYVLQCWHYADFFGFDAWDLAVSVAGEFPRIYTVPLDRDAQAVVARRLEAWWRRHIVGGEEPPMDASPVIAAYLQQAHPRHKRPDLRAANEQEVDLLREYEQLRIEEKAMKGEKAVLENLLRKAVGDREGLTWFGGQFTWRKTRDRKIVEWESMARGLLNQFVKDPQQRADLEEFYTRTKEGTRRMLLKSDAFKEEQEDAA